MTLTPLFLWRFALTVGLVLTAQNLGAHSTNPRHLDSWIQNPFNSVGRITAPAPTHHKLRNQTPQADLSLDIAYPTPGDAAGRSVYFKGAARTSGTAFRGRIIQGGYDAPVAACYGDLRKGGYLVKVQIEMRATPETTWTTVGWVIYAHLTRPTSTNNTTITSGQTIATVGSGFPVDGKCWTAPHVHVEAYNYFHYAGYVSRSEGSSVPDTGNLACVGGSRTAGSTC